MTLAVLGVAVLIVALIALRHPAGHSTSAGSASRPASTHASESPSPSVTSTARTAPSTPHTPPPTAAVARLPLAVLNNTAVRGLAQQAQRRFEAGGWTVTSLGNLTNDIISTCAYYDSTVTGARAAALALQTQFPAIKRVQPKFRELPPGPIVVVLTSDYVAS